MNCHTYNDCCRPKTGAYGRRLISASQFKLALRCMARWGFEYLGGFREPASEAMERGTENHLQMELHQTTGKIPSSPAALAALKYAPASFTAEAEVPCRFDVGEGPSLIPFVGYIDLAYDLESVQTTEGEWVKTPRPIGSTGITCIHDWKFTSKLSNAMSEDELRMDPAANIYAYEAYLGGAREVWCRWVYVTATGKPYAKEVWAFMSLDDVEETILKIVESVRGLALHQLYSLKPDPNTLDKNNETDCRAFRRPCLQMTSGRCKNEPKKFSLKGKTKVTTPDFTKSIADTFPTTDGAKKAPPPPPGGKKAPPPPAKKVDIAEKWEKHKADLQTPDPEPGTVERGDINSPEADETPSATPEEAAAKQDLDKPVEATPDELDDMDRDQLKALGEKLGCISPKSKAREPSMRSTIRAYRLSNPNVQVDETGEDFVAPDRTIETPSATPIETLAAEAQARGENVGRVPDLGEGKKPLRDVVARYRVVLEDAEGQPLEPRRPVGRDGSLEHVTAPNTSFILLVGCSVVEDKIASGIRVIPARKLVEAAHAKLGINDYRFVDFGKGGGELVCAARECIVEDGVLADFDFVTVDPRSPAGSVLMDLLCEFAAVVIR